jgi:hypothetical protein
MLLDFSHANQCRVTMCVCACPLVMRGDTVKHALTSTSSPPNDVPSIPWSPVVLPRWTPLGGLLEQFPTDSCILDVGLHGSCCWATPQPRNLSLHVINTGTLCTGTAQTRRAELKLGIWAIVVTCHTAHMARVGCKAGIKCLSSTEKREGPTLVARKC